MNKTSSKKAWLAIISLLILIVAGCNQIPPGRSSTTDAPENQNQISTSDRQTESDAREKQIYLVSKKYGFSLEAPGFWSGKVDISEENNCFTVRHRTTSREASVKNPIVLNIIEYGSIEEWEQDAKKENEPFPYQKLGIINGKVYASIPLFDFPYDDKSPADKKEYAEIVSSVERVLKTFTPLKNDSETVAERQMFEEQGSKYSVAGIDDPVGFEQYFHAIQSLISDDREDDREFVVKNFRYPVDLHINNQTVTIKNAREMLEQYDSVFTPRVKKAVAEQKVEDLFVNDMGVMVGDGQLWFGVADGEKYYILTVNP